MAHHHIQADSACATVTLIADTDAWSLCLNRFEGLQSKYCDLDEQHSDLAARVEAALEKLPHVEVGKLSNGHQPLSTSDLTLVNVAERWVDDVASGRILTPTENMRGDYELCCQLVAAARERSAQSDRLGEELGLPALEERLDALFNELEDARWDLIRMPAPDCEALLWKLEYLLAADHGESTAAWALPVLAQTKIDMRRLLKGGAA